MNERIKQLAEQAGFNVEKTLYGEKVFVDGRGVTEELARFAELVRKDEREACAKFFDANEDRLFWGSAAAKEIRGRTD